jgi:hypothetical protein
MVNPIVPFSADRERRECMLRVFRAEREHKSVEEMTGRLSGGPWPGAKNWNACSLKLRYIVTSAPFSPYCGSVDLVATPETGKAEQWRHLSSASILWTS